jgi:hypothetical protein
VFILKQTGQYSDEQIVDWAVRSCFSGLGGPAPPAKGKRPKR